MRVFERLHIGFYPCYLLFIVAVLVGCNRDEGDAISIGGDVIIFEDYNFKDEVSRGSMVEAFDTGDSFGVFAYTVYLEMTDDTTPDIMDNTEVTLDSDGDWNYSPIAFWASTGRETHFVAYAPYEASTIGISTVATSGYPVISYSMPSDCVDQPDLLVAAQEYEEQSSNGVNFSFSHQLSAIGFMVKGDSSMTLTSITLKGIDDMADLTYDGSVWSWGNYSNSVSSFDAGITEISPSDDGTSTLATTDTGYLMVIPQTTTSSSEVTISYCYTSEPTIATIATLSLPEITWAASNKYLYTVTLGVNISIEILPWTEGGNVDDDVSDPEGSVSTDPWDDNDQSDSFSDPDASFNITDWNNYNSGLDDVINDPDANITTDWDDSTDDSTSLSDPDSSVSTDGWEDSADSSTSLSDPDSSVSTDGWEDSADSSTSLSDPDSSVSTDGWEDSAGGSTSLSDPETNLSTDWDESADSSTSLTDPNASVSTDSWTETDLDGTLSDPNASVSTDSWTETDLDGSLSDPNAGITADNWTETTLSGEVTD